jgi:hypothetical protein
MNKVFKIIRSRLFRSDVQPYWYYERLEVCNKCKYNSKHVTLSLWQKFLYLLNSLKPFCTICSCQLDAKASEITEDCGIIGIGKESKWKSINIKNK